MFGTKRRDQASERAIATLTDNLSAQLTVYINMGILIDALEADPYIAGYISGKIHSFIAYSIRAEGLNQSDANQVSGRVILNIFGNENGRIVSEALKRHASEATREYKQAQNRGVLVVAYAVGARNIQSEPEYDKATEAFKSATETIGVFESDEDLAAIGGLEEIWFAQYIKAYM